MIPYKYKIGNFEARNYVLENYEIKMFDHYNLVKHEKDRDEVKIGIWHVDNGIASLNIVSRLPDINDREALAYEEICRTTKKRIENDLD